MNLTVWNYVLARVFCMRQPVTEMIIYERLGKQWDVSVFQFSHVFGISCWFSLMNWEDFYSIYDLAIETIGSMIIFFCISR